jgi:hypothetical protein
LSAVSADKQVIIINDIELINSSGKELLQPLITHLIKAKNKKQLPKNANTGLIDIDFLSSLKRSTIKSDNFMGYYFLVFTTHLL